MRRHTLFLLLLIAAMAASLFLPPREAQAIPAFARKYQQSCSTCHGPFPRLKPYGEELAARGFRLEDPAQEPPRAEHDVGDPLLKLPRDLPLAVRMEGHAEVRENAASDGDFETPYVFKILSGGPITPKVSYYLYFILEQNQVEGLEDAYLQFNDVFGSGVDTIFGQFQVSDPLFKRELHFFPQGEDGRWAVSGLYNRVESDDLAAEVESGALAVNYLLGRNLRLLGEVARDFGLEENRASLGVVTAF